MGTTLALATRYAKPGALNVFSDVVMKVLMFIELASGVKYPKITTVGSFLKRPFVDVLSSCRSFFLFFCGNVLFFSCLEFFCLYFGIHFTRLLNHPQASVFFVFSFVSATLQILLTVGSRGPRGACAVASVAGLDDQPIK